MAAAVATIQSLETESFPPPNSNKMNAKAMATAFRQGLFANPSSIGSGSKNKSEYQYVWTGGILFRGLGKNALGQNCSPEYTFWN